MTDFREKIRERMSDEASELVRLEEARRRAFEALKKSKWWNRIEVFVNPVEGERIEIFGYHSRYPFKHQWSSKSRGLSEEEIASAVSDFLMKVEKSLG